MATTLRFRDNGTFTVLQFTDIHWHTGEKADQPTRELMQMALREEQPDLVILSGDVVEGCGSPDPRAAYRQVVACIEEQGIPWAAVFGNHDDECGNSRQELLAAQLEHPHCLSQAGPDGLTGVGNYTLELYGATGDQVKAVLYLLDSNAYAPFLHGLYDWIHEDQIEWYRERSRAYTAANGGKPLPALAFFHIPLPEYDTVWNTATCYGTKLESVCCPRVNSGFFKALVEMGDVTGTFVGHDHINDYWGELEGIRLCYGRATGFNTYGREGFQRGARVIRLHEGVRGFDTWLRLADGSVVTEQPEHRPED